MNKINDIDKKLNYRRYNDINGYRIQIDAYETQLKILKDLKHSYIGRLAKKNTIDKIFMKKIYTKIQRCTLAGEEIEFKKSLFEQIVFNIYEDYDQASYYQEPEGAVEYCYNEEGNSLSGELEYDEYCRENREDDNFKMYSCEHDSPTIIGSEKHVNNVIDEDDDLLCDYDQKQNNFYGCSKDRKYEEECAKWNKEKLIEEKKYLAETIIKKNLSHDEIVNILDKIEKIDNDGICNSLKDFLAKYIYISKPKTCKEPKCGHRCYRSLNNVDHHSYQTKKYHENHEGYCYTYWAYD